jgi:predicted SprT family Zn-dependent metalloprotease
MRHHGLLGQPGLFGSMRPSWRFAWSRSVSAFGTCDAARREIRLSRPLVERNPPWEVLDCILHEIAHALAPGAGHGPAWRATAWTLGCDGRRTYQPDEVVTMPRRYVYTCGCGTRWPRHRRTLERRYCRACGEALTCVDTAGAR